MRLVVGLWGSGEFQPWAEEPDRWLLEHARTGDGSVIVLPTASAPEGGDVFDRWASMGVAHYERMGVRSTSLPLRIRADADRPEFLDELERCSMVYFSGGNPAHLARALAGSPFWLRLLARMREGMAYGGCSAGVAALGDVTGDSAIRDVSRLDRWQKGLALFPGLSFGAHWDALDRFVPGLKEEIVERVPQGSRLLAIDEDTAVVGDGRTWHVMGRGAAHLLQDGAWTDFETGSTLQLPMMEPATASATGAQPEN
jgi:cyanophycinase